MKLHVLVVAVLLVVDVFALGMGACALLSAYGMIVLGAVQLIRGLIADRRRLRHGARLIAIYSMLAGTTYAVVSWQQAMADRRAAAIVQAIKTYKAQHGECPTTLDALVPRYLPEVPLAKHTLVFNKFEYLTERHSGMLRYTRLAPFVMRSFDCDTESWHRG